MGILGMAAGAIGGEALGLINKAIDNKSQISQQEKLQNLQIKGQKEMTDYNAAAGLQMWKDTNAQAQREEYEKAGLNVGMMYGGTGSGGATASVAGGNVSGGQASASRGAGEQTGMAMEGMMQAQMMQAQIELTKAQTEKAKVEAAKTAGVDTEVATASKGKITAETIATELENNYKTVGGGLDNRYAQETATIYNTTMDTRLKEIQVEQMPEQLKLRTQEVVLKGQEIAIRAKEATTHRMQLEVYKEVEKLRRELTESIATRDRNQKGTLQANEIEQRIKEQSQQKTQFEAGLDQRETEFWTNTTMRAIEDAIGAAVPWYEPSEHVTTGTESYDRNGEYQGSRQTTTIRRRQ